MANRTAIIESVSVLRRWQSLEKRVVLFGNKYVQIEQTFGQLIWGSGLSDASGYCNKAVYPVQYHQNSLLMCN